MNEYIAVLLVMLGISALGGGFVSVRKQAEKPVKVMLFVLYFWGLFFLQIALFALGYYWLTG